MKTYDCVLKVALGFSGQTLTQLSAVLSTDCSAGDYPDYRIPSNIDPLCFLFLGIQVFLKLEIKPQSRPKKVGL